MCCTVCFFNFSSRFSVPKSDLLPTKATFQAIFVNLIKLHVGWARFFLQFVTENGEVQLKNSQDIGAKESLSTSHFITSHEMKRQWCFDIQPWVDICPPLSVPSKVHLGCTCTFIPSITWPFLSSDWSRAQLHLLLIGQDMHSADHLSWTKKELIKEKDLRCTAHCKKAGLGSW